MQAAIDDVPALIKVPAKHEYLLKVMAAFRAVSVKAEGPSYDAVVTH